MGKRYVVTITKELEDWWGLDDLEEDYPTDKEEFARRVIELLLEDVQAVVEDAEWKVEEVSDGSSTRG